MQVGVNGPKYRQTKKEVKFRRSGKGGLKELATSAYGIINNNQVTRLQQDAMMRNLSMPLLL